MEKQDIYSIILIIVIFCFANFSLFVSKELVVSLKQSVYGDIWVNQSMVKRQPPKQVATIIFVGDMMLSRSVGIQIDKNNDFKYPFLNVAEILKSADLTFGNLEGPISDRGANQGSIYSFRAKPEVVEGLTYAGFDVLCLANNHMWDWGRFALEDTLSILRQNSIEPIGAGNNYEDANDGFIKEIKGNRIAFLAYTDLYPKTLWADDSIGLSSYDLENIKSKIQTIKQNDLADLVVVTFHWGQEYQTHSNTEQQSIAHELIDIGADIIIGHHPHVVQEIEHYKNGFIAYSLGNFIFDQYFSEETMSGLMVRVQIKNKKIEAFEPFSTKLSKTFQPQIYGIQ